MGMIQNTTYALLITTCVWFISFPPATYAFPKTDADFAKLPKFCQARYNRPGSNPVKWKKLIGPMYVHIHHYCSGLNHINKAYSISQPKIRKRVLNRALGGIDYVLKRAQPTFILLPELHTKKGQVLVQLKRYGDAVIEYNSAIRIKHDYVRAYASLSDLHIKLKNHESAIEVLQKGLGFKPNSKSLMRRLNKLNNK